MLDIGLGWPECVARKLWFERTGPAEWGVGGIVELVATVCELGLPKEAVLLTGRGAVISGDGCVTGRLDRGLAGSACR